MPHKDKQRQRECRRRLYHSRIESERARQRRKYHEGSGQETHRKYYMANADIINARLRRKWATEKAWRQANPDKKLDSVLRSRYGITLAQYRAMVEEQKGVCAICNSFTPTKSHSRLCVDHDHSTGRIRGLLCNACNRGLGDFANSILRLRRATAYLE